MCKDGFATSDYFYRLPEELIAQDPLTDRASSRLLVLDRRTGRISHHLFHEITSFLRAGDLLVLNDTRVIPARLYGKKPDTGASVEVLLLKRVTHHAETPAEAPGGRPACVWECLVRPGKKLKNGAGIVFGEADADGHFPLEAAVEEITPEGNRIIRFSFDGVFEEVLDALGEMPLPPYIRHKLADRDRYNTVYAKHDGSAAAPTAGLHFTEEVLEQVREKGADIAYVTLHVGLGTFRPVKARDVRDHHMHSEWYRVPEETAQKIRAAKQAGGRVICVGTTSCRTLESAAQRVTSGRLEASPCPAGSGETDIFIFPGYEFLVMDGLITNFHLPESTLLMLVSAFAGREHVLFAYREAVERRYRFFSFGDAMLIL